LNVTAAGNLAAVPRLNNMLDAMQQFDASGNLLVRHDMAATGSQTSQTGLTGLSNHVSAAFLVLPGK
jgi:hypothetical protein